MSANQVHKFLTALLSGSKSVNHNRCRFCHTDRIRQLDFTFICQSCRYDVLGHISCRISRRAVNLRAVFSGECSAAVTGISAVSIYDDFSSGKSCVSMRTSDDKTSCRINIELGLIIHHLCRKNLVKDFSLNILMNLFLSHIRIMLG